VLETMLRIIFALGVLFPSRHPRAVYRLTPYSLAVCLSPIVSRYLMKAFCFMQPAYTYSVWRASAAHERAWVALCL